MATQRYMLGPLDMKRVTQRLLNNAAFVERYRALPRNDTAAQREAIRLQAQEWLMAPGTLMSLANACAALDIRAKSPDYDASRATREQIRRALEQCLFGCVAHTNTLFLDLPTLDFMNTPDPEEGAALVSAPVSATVTPTQPTKENPTMSRPSNIKIETRVFINGVEAKDYTDGQLFDLIAAQERAVMELEMIKNRPEALTAEIAARNAGIAALVKFMNDRKPKAD